jgi:DNA-binding NarL/FixJ family response regulator
VQTTESASPPPIDVWLIDDNDEYRHVVASAVDLSGTFRCRHHWRRCEPALEALERGEPPPRVLLLDIGLPGIGGLSAIELFRQRSPSMQVIMLTVFDADDKVVTALHNGASGYLLKSSSMTDVVRAVEQVVQGGLPLDPMVTRHLVHDAQPVKKRSPADYGLTERETQVLRYMSDGLPFQEIAQRMYVSLSTINQHALHINEKLKVNSRSLAVAKAIREGLV